MKILSFVKSNILILLLVILSVFIEASKVEKERGDQIKEEVQFDPVECNRQLSNVLGHVNYPRRLNRPIITINREPVDEIWNFSRSHLKLLARKKLK